MTEQSGKGFTNVALEELSSLLEGRADKKTQSFAAMGILMNLLLTRVIPSEILAELTAASEGFLKSEGDQKTNEIVDEIKRVNLQRVMLNQLGKQDLENLLPFSPKGSN